MAEAWGRKRGSSEERDPKEGEEEEEDESKRGAKSLLSPAPAMDFGVKRMVRHGFEGEQWWDGGRRWFEDGGK